MIECIQLGCTLKRGSKRYVQSMTVVKPNQNKIKKAKSQISK